MSIENNVVDIKSIRAKAERATIFKNSKGLFLRINFCEDDQFFCEDEKDSVTYVIAYDTVDNTKEAFYQLTLIE
jgi:uncharacterized protein YqfB (UPF0267 family)